MNKDVGFEMQHLDGSRTYVTICETFIHHYTGEPMRRIRLDYVIGDSYAVSNFITVNLKDFDEQYWAYRVNES